MRYLCLRARDWLKDQEGQDVIEYTVLVALISTISAFSLMVLGVNVSTLWNTLSGWLGSVPSGLPIP